jgi:Icc protein
VNYYRSHAGRLDIVLSPTRKHSTPIVSSQPVHLLHLTDMHLHASLDATMRGLNTYESFRAVVDHVIADGRNIDAIAVTGDIVQDETRQGYERFCKTIGDLDAPIHCIPGNHDSPDIMDEMLNQAPYVYCGATTYENWCLLMMNSSVRWDDCGRLDAQQMEFLEQSLDAHREHNILIGMHHHPLPTGSRWLDGIDMRDHEAFYAVTDKHPNVRCVIWGHVHQESDRERNNVRMFSTPSTGAQFLPDSDVFRLDTRPPGYRWITLHPDGHIDTEVVWID